VAKKISSRLIKPRRFFFDAFIFEDLKSNLLGFFVNFLFQTQMPLERHCEAHKKYSSSTEKSLAPWQSPLCEPSCLPVLVAKKKSRHKCH
jgi:hypothetical protein